MSFKKSFFLILLIQISHLLAEKEVSFEGYKVVSLVPSTKKHLELIENLQNHRDFDVISHSISQSQPSFVLLSPKSYLKYKPIFDKNGLANIVVNENFQRAIDAEKQAMQFTDKRNPKSIVGKFAQYNEIANFLEEVAEGLNNPPSMSAYTYVVGSTHESRAIKALVLKASTATRGIFIDCGIHAREWIAISSCVWFIDQLKTGWEESDPQTLRILNHYEIHIIPVLNPDGYEYSRITNRMWRKNRRPNQGSTCIGTDLNRNFEFKWMTGGSSSLPCSDTFAGPSAGSELETKALVNSINAKLGYWDAYLTVHTYGNYWLSSWSYTNTEFPPDLDELIAKSRIGADAMEAAGDPGTKITTGNSGLLFGRLSGVSDDWAKGTANIKYSYTLELAPGKDDPQYALYFELPEDRVPGVGRELTAGFKAFLNSLF